MKKLLWLLLLFSVPLDSQIGGQNGYGCNAISICMNASTDLGAQINAAVTALGSAGGIIYLPAGTYTMSTTATINQQSISLMGAGPFASIINCTVAGDCLIIHPPHFSCCAPPATGNALGGPYAQFTIEGNGATGQNLLHTIDMSSTSMHDIFLDGANSSTSSCLLMEDAIYWTEENYFYNFQTGYNCQIAVNLKNDSGNSNQPGSFGYNHFDFHMQPYTGQYGFYLQGNAQLYNGYLHISANAIGGTIMHIGDTSGTGGFGGEPANERLELQAEGDTTGTVYNITTSASVPFVGWAIFYSLTQGTAYSSTFYVSPLNTNPANFVAVSTTAAYSASAAVNSGTGSTGYTFTGNCTLVTGNCLEAIGSAESTGNAALFGYNIGASQGVLGIWGEPQALGWDVSGNVYVAAGSSVIYRCPNSPYQVYWGSTAPSGCGTPVDTGLRTK
jgi:hypothetical protein